MGKITYINASPVYYGIDHGMQPDWLTLVPDVPAALNRQIKNGTVDISPISAAFYAMNHRALLLVPDLSISCDGDVLSVICASRYPLDELTGKNVMFSNESASGASFLKMIFSLRKIHPRYTVGYAGDIAGIPEDVDAVMVIGDAALTQPWETRFAFRYDLGGLWQKMTGLPFVFAVWVVREAYARTNPERVAAGRTLLLESRSQGYQHLDQIINTGAKKLTLPPERISDYYNCLYCDLDDRKVQGMDLFFTGLYEQGILKEKTDIRFFKSSGQGK